MMIFIYITGGLLFLILLLVLAVLVTQLIRLQKGNRRVRAEMEQVRLDRLEDIGSVDELRVLPLVDYYADDPDLRTEAGVSYLVAAGDTTILLDVGFNKKKDHPSPLLHNMKALGISLDDLDALFISHLHLDHVGGMAEQRQGRFSLSQGKVDLPPVPVYVPEPIVPSAWNPGPVPEVVTRPRYLAEGVASIGVIPRNLFLLGYTREHSLAVNVRGKGIVLIIGCGHQTIERILDRSQKLFDAPIYGIIGGLHYPVRGGRIMLGPVNLQNLVGGDRPPWQPIGQADVNRAIAAIKAVDPQFIALSPHDSSDWSLEQFTAAFGDRCHDLRVGRSMRI